jgi:hypothetical protein
MGTAREAARWWHAQPLASVLAAEGGHAVEPPCFSVVAPSSLCVPAAASVCVEARRRKKGADLAGPGPAAPPLTGEHRPDRSLPLELL